MRNIFLRRTTEEETSGSARRWITTIPGWVKIAVVIMIILVLLFAILHLTGHGMGHMHMSFLKEGRHML